MGAKRVPKEVELGAFFGVVFANAGFAEIGDSCMVLKGFHFARAAQKGYQHDSKFISEIYL